MNEKVDGKLWVEALRLSEGLSLPKAAATWVFAYLAKRGGGKTYNAAVEAEEMIINGIPVVVIDGMGIWWGLRVGPDGKGPGLPVVVFGGEHADLPLTLDSAAEIARAIVESNINAVLDVSDFSKTQSRKIVTVFLDELYRVNRVDRHVFIEESDMYAPQRPIGPEENICLAAVDGFVRRGGNKNLGCTLITQRSAVLNKNILTQSDCLVVLRTKAPQDKAAVRAWIQENVDSDNAEEVQKAEDMMKSLGTLRNGEAWVWHTDEPYVFAKFLFRCRITFHATREFIKSPEAANVKLMDASVFIAKFKAAFQGKSASLPSINAQGSVGVSAEHLRKVKELETEVVALRTEIEEFRSGSRLPESVQKRINVLELQEQDLIGKLKEAKEYGQKITQMEAERCDQLEEVHKKLKAFEGLQSALSAVVGLISEEQIGVVVEKKLRDIVFEMQKDGLSGNIPESRQDGAAAVVVTEITPEIQHRIDHPIVETTEATRDGQLLTLALHGFFDEKRRLSEIGKEMERCYLFGTKNLGRDLPPYLGKLVELKVLQREQTPQGGWVYWLADGAKDRIKEAS